MNDFVHIEPESVAEILLCALNGENVQMSQRGYHIEVHCQGMPIARLAWEEETKDHRVVALACYAGRHGTHGAFKAIADKISALTKPPDESQCHICQGRKWLATSSVEGKTAAAQGVAVRCYRGVHLPSSSRLDKASKESTQDLFTALFGSRVMSEFKELQDEFKEAPPESTG